MKKYMHQGFFLYDLLEMPDERNLQIHISLTAKRLKKLKVVGILRSAVKYLWTQCYLAVETDVSNNVFQYTRV